MKLPIDKKTRKYNIKIERYKENTYTEYIIKTHMLYTQYL